MEGLADFGQPFFLGGTVRLEIRNEIRKWFVGILTTTGMTTLVISVIRPMFERGAGIEYEALPAGIFALGLAAFILTTLEDDDG